jgi:hypothetical protein
MIISQPYSGPCSWNLTHTHTHVREKAYKNLMAWPHFLGKASSNPWSLSSLPPAKKKCSPPKHTFAPCHTLYIIKHPQSHVGSLPPKSTRNTRQVTLIYAPTFQVQDPQAFSVVYVCRSRQYKTHLLWSKFKAINTSPQRLKKVFSAVYVCKLRQHKKIVWNNQIQVHKNQIIEHKDAHKYTYTRYRRMP